VCYHCRNSLRLTLNRRRQRGVDACELFLRVAEKIVQRDGQVSPTFLTWWQNNNCDKAYPSIGDVASSFVMVPFILSVFVDVKP
jgi:hypothetical protein